MRSGFVVVVALVIAAQGCARLSGDKAATSPLDRPVVVTHEVTFPFDRPSDAERVKREFVAVLSGEGAQPGMWDVQDREGGEGGHYALVQVSNDPTNGRFPLLIYDKLSARDVDVWLHIKPLEGKIDQAGGIVIRYQDKDNYYIVRSNALENNVRLYKVVEGKRIQFAGTDAKVRPTEWHVLKLAARGNHFEVSYDGRQLFEAEDSTFPDAGKVGLWTKADSVTAFGNLKIETYDKER